MRYLSQPVEFVSASKTQTGDYTNFYVHVKDEGGYLTKLTCTENAFPLFEGLPLGARISLVVLSFTKKYKRKDGSGDFWMHRELVTDVRPLSSDVYADDYLSEVFKD